MAPEDDTTDTTEISSATNTPRTTDASGPPGGEAATSSDEPSAPAPRKRAPRRATTKAAAPRSAASRVSKKTAAASPPEPSSQARTEGSDDAGVPAHAADHEASTAAGGEPEPVKKATRKRATRKQAPPTPAHASTEVAPQPPPRTASAADSDTRDGADGADDSAAGAATVASLDVLFQAPAPTKAKKAARVAKAPTTGKTTTTTKASRTTKAGRSKTAKKAPDGEDTSSPEVEERATESGENRSEPEAPADLAQPDSTDTDPQGDGETGAAPDEATSEPADEATSEPADEDATPRRSRRRRGGKGRRGRGGGETSESSGERGADDAASGATDSSSPLGADDELASGSSDDDQGEEESASSRRRRRRRRGGSSSEGSDEAVSTRVRAPRGRSDEPSALRGSTRLEAKKQRRREGREAGRRRTVITEAEFLARREAVDRVMVVRNKDGRTQMGVLEDGVLVEHYIDQATNVSMAGSIYLGRVQNVLPSMEAAFVDIGKGRNAVLYAGEVNWDAAGMEGNQPKRIENALSSGQSVLVQVTKDPIGHKGARLTSQISLPGRYLVYVPNSSMTGISRKLPDTERTRLKKILREVVPDSAGVIVRTAAEGASEAELRADVERLTTTWEQIQSQAEAASSGKAGKSKGRKKNGGSGSAPAGTAPMLLHGEPDLTVRVIRDVFNEDFTSLVVAGEQAWAEIHPYITAVAPDLADRVTQWSGQGDLFTHHRVDEQLAKAMDRKVWLPSGGSLVIDRTEAMTVVDVNTGKFVGSGGNLEETVTKNNIEAAEELVRQLRLRDIGGIIVVDFIDMVLESNRDLVVRRLLECLGRDRTKHQVAEVTSLGLVQMTRKRVGSGLIEVFGETCEHCNGRGFIIHSDPVDRDAGAADSGPAGSGGSGSASGRRRGRGTNGGQNGGQNGAGGNGGDGRHQPESPQRNGPTAAQIAAAAHAAALKTVLAHPTPETPTTLSVADEIAAELDAATPSQRIDREIAAELDTPPDTSTTPDIGQGTETTSETTPETPMPVSVADEIATELDAPTETAEPAVEPAPRGRRRRGRVVAPAGPPRVTTPAGTGGDG